MLEAAQKFSTNTRENRRRSFLPVAQLSQPLALSSAVFSRLHITAHTAAQEKPNHGRKLFRI